MSNVQFSTTHAWTGLRGNGVARRGAEKFLGAWLSCVLVMSRGDFMTAFSLEHARIASICGGVGAAVAVALLIQMESTTDGVVRQATISAISTFIGDIVARHSQFSPQWIEPMITAGIAAGIAVAFWYAKRLAKSFYVAKAEANRKSPADGEPVMFDKAEHITRAAEAIAVFQGALPHR
jgi:hypothetical protein